MKHPKNFRVVNLLMLTVAGIVNAFGITIFLTPVKLYDSGISGTSMLLEQITPPYLSLSFFLLLLNIPLFLFGLKKLGRLFTAYAIYTVAVYSLFAWLITDVFPIDVSIASPLAGTDLLLCALFGGVISGIGSGLAIRFGGAMDGIEVMAVIFSKRLGITVGTFVIVEGIDRSKCAIIITEHPDEICKALSETFESGVTHLSAKGGYSNRDKSMIYFIINRYQIIRMKDIVHNIDPFAYITISEVADIFSSNNNNQ